MGAAGRAWHALCCCPRSWLALSELLLGCEYSLSAYLSLAGRRKGRQGRKGRKGNCIRQEEALAAVQIFARRTPGVQCFTLLANYLPSSVIFACARLWPRMGRVAWG